MVHKWRRTTQIGQEYRHTTQTVHEYRRATLMVHDTVAYLHGGVSLPGSACCDILARIIEIGSQGGG